MRIKSPERMKRNFIMKLVGEAGVRLLSTVFILVLARVIGAADFGQYAAAYAFVSLFMIFVDLGLNTIVTREIARVPDQRLSIMATSNFLKLTAACLTWALVHFFAQRWPAATLTQLQIIDPLTVLCIAYTLTDYMAALLSGKEEMGWEALLKSCSRFISVLCGGGALLYTHRLYPTLVVSAGAAMMSLVLGAALIRYRFGAIRWAPEVAMMKQLGLKSLPLFAAVLFSILYDNQNVLLLQHFDIADTQIGLFAAANKIIDVLKVFPVLVAGSFLPVLSRTMDVPLLQQRARRMLRVTALGTGALTFCLVPLADPLVRILFGSGFADAAPLLRLLLLAYYLIAINHMLLTLLVVHSHERYIVGGAALACLANFLAASTLIPRFGASGACFALLGSQTLYLAFQAWGLTRCVPSLWAPAPLMHSQ